MGHSLISFIEDSSRETDNLNFLDFILFLDE